MCQVHSLKNTVIHYFVLSFTAPSCLVQTFPLLRHVNSRQAGCITAIAFHRGVELLKVEHCPFFLEQLPLFCAHNLYSSVCKKIFCHILAIFLTFSFFFSSIPSLDSSYTYLSEFTISGYKVLLL